MKILRRIHHVAIICSDYEASRQFYTGVLGFEILHEVYRAERNSYKLDLGLQGEYTLELFSFPYPPARVSAPEATGLRHIAFQVADLEESLAWCKSQGVAAEEIRMDLYTRKRFAFIFDPDHLPIELYEEEPEATTVYAVPDKPPLED